MTSGKLKLTIGAVGVVAVLAVVGILLNNRAATKAKGKLNEIQTAFPVSLSEVKRSKLDENLVMVGSVCAEKEVQVVSETNGRVVSLNFDAGSRVGAGSTLVKVDDELKRAALINAEANYEKTKKDLARFEQLYKEKSATESQLDGARLAFKMAESQFIIAKRQLSDTRVTAPIAGTVTQRMVERGTVLSPGTPVAYIVDVSSVKVKVNVAERDAFKMKIGDAVSITSDVYPNAKFTGRIKTISAKSDEAHTYPVEITLPNNGQKQFKAGMIARVSFTGVERENTIVIPREAIVGSIKNAKVYVAEGDVARLREIVTGAESNGMIEVLQGLNTGEMVVKSGQVNLKDNAKIIVVKD